MLASVPASMVNQKPTDLGIPNRFKLNSSRFSWQYLRSYFRLLEPHIAARQNWLPAISRKSKRLAAHSSGDVFSALAMPPAPVR